MARAPRVTRSRLGIGVFGVPVPEPLISGKAPWVTGVADSHPRCSSPWGCGWPVNRGLRIRQGFCRHVRDGHSGGTAGDSGGAEEELEQGKVVGAQLAAQRDTVGDVIPQAAIEVLDRGTGADGTVR